jgi:Tol biopolymer transport system component
VIDLTSGAQVSLGGANAYNPVWSPDGSRIAYIDSLTVVVVGADGSNPRALTQPDNYAVVGWSPDGTKLYFTLLGADGFILNSLDVASGEIKPLFTLQDSSRKAPFATIAPNGEWIVYRGSDNGTLYLVRPDGSDQHAVMTAYAISSMVWSKDSTWLGMSLLNSPSDERKIVLLQPGTCQAYLLPTQHGDLEGLFMP